MPSAGSNTSSWQEYNAFQNKNYKGTGSTGSPNAPGSGNTGAQWAESILGGPVGWYEAASGKSLLGDSDPFSRTTVSQYMTQDVYDSMTPDEWKHFSKLDGQGQKDFVDSRTQELQKQNAGKDAAKVQQDKLAQDQAARKAQQDAIVKKLSAFADQMNMSVPDLLKNDQFAQALQSTTFNNATSRSFNSGVGAGGGISAQNADLNTQRALLGYQQQRQQAGNQALNQAYGMINNQGLQAEDLRRYNQGLDLQMQQAQAGAQFAKYQQGLSQSGNTLGMLGGIIGGVYGGAAGASAGQKIGSSVGQSQYQSNNPYTPYQYSYPSGGGGMTGGGGGNY